MKPKGLFSAFAGMEKDAPSARNRWMVVVSILLAAFLLYLTLRDLNWRAFFVTLKNARYVYLPFVFLWSSATFLVRALRLRVLLSGEKKLPLPNVFWANMAGYLGNNILPARAGEFIRAAYLGKQNNISMSYALAAGLVERLMDVIALIALGALALSFTGIVSPAFQNALKSISVFGLAGLFIIFTLPRFNATIGRLILILPVLNESKKNKLNHFLQHFIGGLKSLHGLTRILQFAGLTGLIWLMDGLGVVLLAYTLNLRLLLSQAFVLLAALGLSSAIPSTPGYVGVYQFVTVTILAPFGISKADALAFILVSQALGYLVICLWGLLGLWQFGKNSRA